jgi:hypothetical protein
MRKGVETQGYLRFEKPLGNQSTIDFDILSNAGTPVPTEKRLNLPDTFLIQKLAIFIYKLPTAALNAAQTLNSFPNPLVYSKAGEAANLMAIYNGFLSVRVNQTVWIDSLDVMRCYRVGPAQNALAVSANATANTMQGSQWDMSDYGFLVMEPKILLSGASANKISITLPSPVDMTGTASTNYAVCYCRGILNQNAANFNS